MNRRNPFDYTVKVRNNTRRIHLRVSLDKGLEVMVPRGVSRKMVDRVLKQNREWILSSLGQIPERLERLAPQDVELQAIGRRWDVEYQATASEGVTVAGKGDAALIVTGDIDDAYLIALVLRRWLTSRAQQELVPWLRAISQEFDLPFEKVLVKGQRTRWASCSAHKTISINRNLLFLPALLVRYVLVHELVHTIQLDHSPKFWESMEERLPGSKDLEREAKGAWHYVPPWAHEK